ncbi:MAG: tetratricopeptide repeat protein [Bacteroidaceae bacterium]|nr:tetratricopeptide repeat protein [Bacteroidaceae bacterium]
MAKQQKTAAPENIEVVTATEAFVDKYKKQIVACVVCVFVLAACIIGWNAYSKSNNKTASEALFPCETYFTEGNYDKALNGDGAACVGFLKVADEYGSTKAGNLARLYAGICLAQTEKYDEAAKQLEQFDMKDDAMVSPAALGLLGNVYVSIGQKDKAIETLKKAAKRADNPSLSPTFLVQAGQLYEADGKKDEALKLYKQVKEQYPTSMVVQMQEIDGYIERASN